MLVGPNQAGKSNVIEALRLLRSLANRDGETVRPFTNYVFDQSIKNKIVVDIALRLSQEEKNKICQWLLQHNTIFNEVNSKKDLIFKYIKYHAEIERIPNAGKNDITEEEFYISNNTGSYTQLIHRVVENSSAIQSLSDLVKSVSDMQSIDEFCEIKLTKKGQKFLFVCIITFSIYFKLNTFRY